MRKELKPEDGSASVEAIVLIPIGFLFLLLCIAFGRYETLRNDVVESAGSAAAAASIEPSAGTAQIAAYRAAQSEVNGTGCQNVKVETDTGLFRPGGSVTIRVTCVVSVGGLGAPASPGSEMISETETAPIDPYRVAK